MACEYQDYIDFAYCLHSQSFCANCWPCMFEDNNLYFSYTNETYARRCKDSRTNQLCQECISYCRSWIDNPDYNCFPLKDMIPQLSQNNTSGAVTVGNRPAHAIYLECKEGLIVLQWGHLAIEGETFETNSDDCSTKIIDKMTPQCNRQKSCTYNFHEEMLNVSTDRKHCNMPDVSILQYRVEVGAFCTSVKSIDHGSANDCVENGDLFAIIGLTTLMSFLFWALLNICGLYIYKKWVRKTWKSTTKPEKTTYQKVHPTEREYEQPRPIDNEIINLDDGTEYHMYGRNEYSSEPPQNVNNNQNNNQNFSIPPHYPRPYDNTELSNGSKKNMHEKYGLNMLNNSTNENEKDLLLQSPSLRSRIIEIDGKNHSTENVIRPSKTSRQPPPIYPNRLPLANDINHPQIHQRPSQFVDIRMPEQNLYNNNLNLNNNNNNNNNNSNSLNNNNGITNRPMSLNDQKSSNMVHALMYPHPLSSTNPRIIPPDLNELTEMIEITNDELLFNKEVGKGAHGTVYQARWCGHEVACKKFNKGDFDSNKITQFIQELKMASQIPPHPNVIRYYGYCKDPLCLIMEYMDGGSVQEYLRYDKPQAISIPVVERVMIAQQAALGIKHLHDHNIVHRDIAARNLLIEDPKYHKTELKVAVSDFGMSRVLNEESYTTTYTHTGPLKWMAPEALGALNEPKYTTKSDVYSFGITLWELLTGQEPYADTTPVNTAVEVLVKQKRPKMSESIPKKLQYLMKRCWDNDPNQRPDFAEIIESLDKFIARYEKQKRQQDSDDDD